MSQNPQSEGILIRLPSSIEDIMERRWKHRDLLISSAERRELSGDVSGARHHRNMAKATRLNLEAFEALTVPE